MSAVGFEGGSGLGLGSGLNWARLRLSRAMNLSSDCEHRRKIKVRACTKGKLVNTQSKYACVRVCVCVRACVCVCVGVCVCVCVFIRAVLPTSMHGWPRCRRVVIDCVGYRALYTSRATLSN